MFITVSTLNFLRCVLLILCFIKRTNFQEKTSLDLEERKFNISPHWFIFQCLTLAPIYSKMEQVHLAGTYIISIRGNHENLIIFLQLVLVDYNFILTLKGNQNLLIAINESSGNAPANFFASRNTSLNDVTQELHFLFFVQKVEIKLLNTIQFLLLVKIDTRSSKKRRKD